jgi:hypothetical protein
MAYSMGGLSPARSGRGPDHKYSLSPDAGGFAAYSMGNVRADLAVLEVQPEHQPVGEKLFDIVDCLLSGSPLALIYRRLVLAVRRKVSVEAEADGNRHFVTVEPHDEVAGLRMPGRKRDLEAVSELGSIELRVYAAPEHSQKLARERIESRLLVSRQHGLAVSQSPLTLRYAFID